MTNDDTDIGRETADADPPRSWDGHELPEISVSLVLGGDDLDPDSITEVLELVPTRSGRKGEVRGPRERLWKTGIWELSVGRARAYDPDALVEQLMRLVQPATDSFRRVLAAPDCNGALSIGVLIYSQLIPAITLSAEAVTWLGDLGIAIDVDVISAYDGGIELEMRDVARVAVREGLDGDGVEPHEVLRAVDLALPDLAANARLRIAEEAIFDAWELGRGRLSISTPDGERIVDHEDEVLRVLASWKTWNEAATVRLRRKER